MKKLLRFFLLDMPWFLSWMLAGVILQFSGKFVEDGHGLVLIGLAVWAVGFFGSLWPMVRNAREIARLRKEIRALDEEIRWRDKLER